MALVLPEPPGLKMNRTEADWAASLEAMRRGGEIRCWRFEALKFRLAAATFYTPDFFVITSEGAVEIHEVKGFWRDDARVKWKVAAAAWPEFTWKAIQREKRRGGLGASGWRIEVA